MPRQTGDIPHREAIAELSLVELESLEFSLQGLQLSHQKRLECGTISLAEYQSYLLRYELTRSYISLRKVILNLL